MQLTTDTPTLPPYGVLRICTAETACPTTVLGQNEKHADTLMDTHAHRTHGVPLPKRAARR